MNQSRVVVVVPCYNEARRLRVDRFQRFLTTNDSVEIVFVDDGSRDNTREVLAQLCAESGGRATVLASPVNRGKAEAVRYGVTAAMDRGAQYVGFWDADLATPLAAIDDFIAVLDERPEIAMVFGARVKLLGRAIERKVARHYLGRVFATFVSTILRLAIYDTQCGAKMFRVRAETRPLFAEPFLTRWIFDVEIIARYIRQVGDPGAAAQGIYEYPLEAWADIAGSKLKASDFAVAFVDLIRIYWKYLRDIPKHTTR